MAKISGKLNKSHVAFGVLIVMISVVVFVYAQFSQYQVKKYARYMVEQNVMGISNELDVYVTSATSSIQLTAYLVTQTMSGGSFEDADIVLDSYLKQTPFQFIEYINRVGVNYTDRGGRFDASDRVYYREGISGNTGIWVNYQPKYSKETLLNFYSPLYYKGNIVGVLTGVLGSETDVQPLLQTNFYGEEMLGILCDENGQVISATVECDRNIYLSDLLQQFGVEGDGERAFSNHMSGIDSGVFEFTSAEGKGIACIARNEETNWRVIQIVPPASFKAAMHLNTRGGYYTAGAITGLLIIYLLYLAVSVGKKHNAQLKEKDQVVKNYEQILIATVSDTAKGIRQVNLKTGQAEHIDFENRKLRQTKVSDWKGWVESQDKYILPEDYPKLKEFCSLEHLRCLEKGITYSISYRSKTPGEGGYHKTYTTTASIIDLDGIKTAIMSTVDNSAAVINEIEQKRLLYLSETDLMTGIHNRGSGESKIKALLAANTPGLFCLLDADKFKSVNDTFGHGVGDQVLIAIANCLKEVFRDSDIVMRLGGDEFAVFAKGVTEKETAISRIHHLFEEIERIDIPELGDYKITLSLGAAFHMPGDGLSFDTLYRNADSCTYESKKQEGNTYTFFEK